MTLRRVLAVLALLLLAAVFGPPLGARLFGWGAERDHLPPPGRSVPIGNGLQLNVVEVGSGPPVVLVHGLPSSAYDWAETPARLAARGYHVVAYDRVGYGYSSRGSTAPERYTYESNARDLIELMKAMSIERAAIVGWSYGGAVAQTAAALAKDRVAKLVLVAAVGPAQPRGDDPLSRLLASPAARPILKWVAAVPPLSRSFTRESLGQAFAGEDEIPSGWLDYTRAMLWLPGTLDAFVLEDQRGKPGSLQPEKLAVPTLIVQGTADAMVPPLVAEDLHRRIAGSKLVKVPGGSHMLPVRQADLLARTIDDFLRDQGPGGNAE